MMPTDQRRNKHATNAALQNAQIRRDCTCPRVPYAPLCTAHVPQKNIPQQLCPPYPSLSHLDTATLALIAGLLRPRLAADAFADGADLVASYGEAASLSVVEVFQVDLELVPVVFSLARALSGVMHSNSNKRRAGEGRGGGEGGAAARGFSESRAEASPSKRAGFHPSSLGLRACGCANPKSQLSRTAEEMGESLSRTMFNPPFPALSAASLLEDVWSTV